MPKQVAITPDVRAVLERCTTRDNVVLLPPGQLDRTLYTAVDKVLKALGGKWNRGAGGHVFAGGIDGQLAEALQAGVAIDAKRTAEQFFTPEHIAMSMAVQAGIADGTHVLEPSAGDGALVRAAIAYGGTVTAIEQDAKLPPQLTEAGSGRQGWLRVVHGDFMEWEPSIRETVVDGVAFAAEIDVVLMNPPFGRGKDMAHVTRALGFLAPGGRLVAIMSPHWTFAEDAASRAFRGLVTHHDGQWQLLPPNSFKASGTAVSTGILTIDKGA